MLRLLRSLRRHACVLLALLLQAGGGASTAWADDDVMQIVAQADLSFFEPAGGTWRQQASNEVMAMAPAGQASIAFFTGADYGRRAWLTRMGLALYPEAVRSACNLDPLQRDTVELTLRSVRAGVHQTHTAVETHPNSGVFRLRDPVSTMPWTATGAQPPGRHLALAGDLMEASVSGCGAAPAASTQIRIDPRAVVFDVGTGRPMVGATVRLIDVAGLGNGGLPGGAARVFAGDGETELPSTVVTDHHGSFSFPQLRPSAYRLEVAPGALHTFPSKRGVGDLGTMGDAYRVQGGASYGGLFQVDADGLGAPVFDLPVDPLVQAMLVQKNASRATVEVAETLAYTVTVRNVGELDLGGVHLHDTLPHGFAYVPGSARLDGAPMPDPDGGRGPRLDFAAGALPLATGRTLTYRVAVGPGALQGDGVNRVQARAESPTAVVSNTAAAAVKVAAGIFSDKAFLLGTVFADCNANGVLDAGERGVPGVRLLIEAGTSVVTDAWGRYSLHGLSPRTHVLKVDGVSLPPGAEPLAVSSRHAGDARTRFIDLHRGELHRADVALRGCEPAWWPDAPPANAAREMNQALRVPLQPGPGAAGPTDVRALPASGRLVDAPADAGTPWPHRLPDRAASAPPPAGSAHRTEGAPGFVDLHDGQVLPDLPLTLRVRGRLGATMGLQLNGTPVDDGHVGERTRSDTHQTDERLYVGLALPSGENTLTATEHDAFGHRRATHQVRVKVAGALARIVLAAPASAPAGADAAVDVRVSLQDRDGLPVVTRLPVTLAATAGEWVVPDLDPQQPGVQTFIEGGSATLRVRAPAAAGTARLTAQAGSLAGDTVIGFVADLRPLTAVGLVEGRLDLRRLKPGSVVAASRDDGFEEELRAFAGGADAGAGARTAVYLKGKVRGDALLTLGYDSAKDAPEGLFRDIQPDAFYPVYGDASVKSFDAQSTGKLYVRLDKNKSSLLYGDYTTPSANPARRLGAYQRSLNGLAHRLETGRWVTHAFAAHDSTRQVVLELRGNGTSGPYPLAAGAVLNSERVELLVRDRNQPALVLRTTPLNRHVDYDFEPLTGRLLFRAPVASLDADLNPVSIRITYEVDQDGPRHWVAGGDAQVQLTEGLSLGGAAVVDRNPLAPLQLASVHATARVADRTVVTAEAARLTRDEALDGKAGHTGQAQRVEVQHDGRAFTGRLHAARADTGFDNHSSMLQAGRREAGAKGAYAIGERTRLTAEALLTADDTGGARREGLLAGVERSVDGGIKLEAGVRHVQARETVGGASDHTSSVRGKAGATVPGLPQASVFVEAEQAVSDAERRLLAVGGAYQLAAGGRAYLRHELISSLTGPYALDPAVRRHTTVLGLEAATGVIGGDGRVFSEYRGRDGLDGPTTEAAIGLRNRWQVRPGVMLDGSLERVEALRGNGDGESAAVTGAVAYTAHPRWKGTARLEWRHGPAGTGVLSTLGLAFKVDEAWTLLGKNVLAVNSAQGDQPARLQERLQLGVAYRDGQNRLNALGRYEYKQERGTPGDVAVRQVHGWSAHAEGQPARRVTLTGRHAVKLVQEQVDGGRHRALAQLIGGRATHDVGERWDVGVAASLMADARLRSRQTALGGEVGYRMQDNLWVSGGWNVTGFRDRDLAADNSTAQGVYLRLRFKFDENLFSRTGT